MNDARSGAVVRPSPLRAEYIARINRVIDHVETHLDESLRLESLASIAHFSPFHFHRIFHALVGETLSRFVLRLRCERAATQLAANPTKSVGAVALDCGFSSSQVFARAFREHFGMSASEWRAACEAGDRNVGNTLRKILNIDRKDGEASAAQNGDLALVHHVTRSEIMSDTITPAVTVRDFPETTVAYLRHIGPYQADAELFGRLFGRLFQWAGPRRLLGPDTLVMSIYHDDPNITAPGKLRTDVCLSVAPGTPVHGEFGTLVIPAGR